VRTINYRRIGALIAAISVLPFGLCRGDSSVPGKPDFSQLQSRETDLVQKYKAQNGPNNLSPEAKRELLSTCQRPKPKMVAIWVSDYMRKSGAKDSTMEQDDVESFSRSKDPHKIQYVVKDKRGLRAALWEQIMHGACISRLTVSAHGNSGETNIFNLADVIPGNFTNIFNGMDRAFAPNAEIRLNSCSVGKGEGGFEFAQNIGQTFLKTNGGTLWLPRDLFSHGVGTPAGLDLLRGSLAGYLKCVVEPGGNTSCSEVKEAPAGY
jgi:hypothetical protein